MSTLTSAAGATALSAADVSAQETGARMPLRFCLAILCAASVLCWSAVVYGASLLL